MLQFYCKFNKYFDGHPWPISLTAFSDETELSLELGWCAEYKSRSLRYEVQIN